MSEKALDEKDLVVREESLEALKEKNDDSQEEIEISEKEKAFEEKINVEKREARERFGDVIGYVNEKYEGPESSLAQSPEQLKAFQEHNEQILDKCIEQGVRRGMDGAELRKLEVAAILHDLNKGDVPPQWAEGVDNVMLVYHGEAAANELGENEQLQQMLRDKLGEESFEENLTHLQEAIKSHMGPHPGFMSGMLAMVNKKLEEKGERQIEHSFPKEGDQVAEVLLAADMYSLASSKGCEKVLSIRSAVPFFRKQDEELSEEYAKLGIELSPAEAALLSAFDSADAARDMIRNEEDKEWIQGAIDDASKNTYDYREPAQDEGDKGEIVSVVIETAQRKRAEFEDARKAKAALDKTKNL